ncbi:related to Isonitrile hydratase [Ustilago trichophora]|uniref:Related to Isonitrile hydratase n=1 Tax=Ustilago trichophora TaxID=86804 RepID=A0A5C3EF47_9BASI|nr:related to Isonitrile hydratase [Ustilago trichophora]
MSQEHEEQQSSSSSPPRLVAGIVLFPGVTQLDYIGPLTTFALHFQTYLLHHTLDAVETDIAPVRALPTATFDELDQVDILVVPGGPLSSINPLLSDASFLGQLRRLGSRARYVTSVCTGSLLLGRAGLLDGYKATTHWTSLDVLKAMGIETLNQRVVHDRNRITAGGVTAGIDFGLTLLQLLKSDDVAKLTQLIMEYDPNPPINAGSPQTAGQHLTSTATQLFRSDTEKALQIVATPALL